MSVDSQSSREPDLVDNTRGDREHKSHDHRFWCCETCWVSQSYGVSGLYGLRLTTNSVLKVGYLFVAIYPTPQNHGIADQNTTMAIVTLAPAFSFVSIQKILSL
jgi:hypothetical protein